jgi:hypothetical protein
MKFLIQNLIHFIVLITFIIGAIVFVAWRFNILKVEPQISSDIENVKSKIQFIENFNYSEMDQIFKTLSNQINNGQYNETIEDIRQDEIGRTSLF